MKNRDPNQKANRNMCLLAYLMAGLFLCLVGYFAWFLQFGREKVINSPYNARLDSFANKVARGSILSSDGLVLAQTKVGEEGGETRSYPYGPLFAHVVGYASASHGKAGLEALANYYLLTSHQNLAQQLLNQLSSTKCQGDLVVTTLDLGLQRAGWEALGDRKGAVVAMEPATGKVLAMVSKPDFDPNCLAENWDNYVSSQDGSSRLLNRATQGLYPPGSTFKTVIGLEYIREHPEDYGDFHFDCHGRYVAGGYAIKCYHGTAHGPQDLTQAFAHSCNGAFASLGLKLDLGSLARTAGQLLFGKPLPLDLPYAKSVFQMKEGAGVWEVLQTSIGQGATQVTPIHNAMVTAAVANGGVLMKPYFLDHVENQDGQVVKKFMPSAYGSLMAAQESEVLKRMMEAVVAEGTGSLVRSDFYSVAGKTGSAEFGTGKGSHAWFVGFAPVQAPQILVSVVVEEGGSGGQTAAPIAKAIFDQWFGHPANYNQQLPMP